MAASDKWPDAINLDEPMSEADQELYGSLFKTEEQRAKQCPEGLIFKEIAIQIIHPNGKLEVGDHVTEYRCELEVNHEDDWHIEGDNRWKAY